MVWSVRRSGGTFASERVSDRPASRRLAQIQEFPVAHILMDGVGDQGFELCEDICQSHRMQGACVPQLLDRLT